MSNGESKSLSSVKQQANESKSFPSYRVRRFIKLLSDAFDHLDHAPYGGTKRMPFSEKELTCLARCLSQHLAISELKMLSDTLAEMLTGRSGSITS